MSEEFVTKALSDLFVTQQEVIANMRGIRKDLKSASGEAKKASQAARDSADAARDSADAAREAAEAARKAAEASDRASNAADRSRGALDAMSRKFSDSDDKMAGLETLLTSQRDRYKDLIDIMGGFANRSADTEVWRNEAELRLTRLEEWVEKQDEAS